MLNEYRFKFLDKWWDEEDGFAFVQDPSIEIKRNEQERAIYEKPYFDFIALGQVQKELEEIQQNTICAKLPIEIYLNGNLLNKGVVQSNLIKNTFNSDNGNVLECELMDNSYNSWIKSFESIEIDLDNVFDLDCNVTDIPPLYTIQFFKSSDSLITFDRECYRLYDVFAHLIKVISRGNITFVSDYFSSGEGTNLMIANGEMIANDVAFEKPKVSLKNLFDPIAKYRNLWIRYYLENGINYARIEPYEYFFSEEEIKIDNVKNVQQITNVEKLYATAKIGDTSEVDDVDFQLYNEFDFNSFREQIINVSNDCSWDTELDLTGDIVVDTDKINYVLIEGANDESYNETLFLIETDGRYALYEEQGTFRFYNPKFTNSEIIKRYYDGVSPVSLFPENYNELDLFDTSVAEFNIPNASSGNYCGKDSIPSSPTTIVIGALFYDGTIINFDNNNSINSDNYNPTLALQSILNRPYSYWQCQHPSNYKFEANLLLGIYPAVTQVYTFYDGINQDLVKFRCVFYHTDNANNLINRYESDYIDIDVESGVARTYKGKLTYVTPDITTSLGDKVYLRIECYPFKATTGQILISIQPSSIWKSGLCSNFQSEHKADGVKNLIYETNFSHKLTESEFKSIRNAPTVKASIESLPYSINGYFKSIKYNYKIGEIDVELIGASSFEKI